MAITKEEAVTAAQNHLRGLSAECPTCKDNQQLRVRVLRASAGTGKVEVSCAKCTSKQKLSLADDVRLKGARRWTVADTRAMTVQIAKKQAPRCPVCSAITHMKVLPVVGMRTTAIVSCDLCGNSDTVEY